METSYPAIIKIGVYAITGCTEPVDVRFDNFSLSEGKTATAKKKAR